MAAEQRRLLEQLMGAEGYGTSTQSQKMRITDPKVCRSFLVGNCHFDLFSNTKADKGACSKIHSKALKAEYEAADEKQKEQWGFEFDYMRDIGKEIDACNGRIEAAQKRLEKTPDEIRQTNALVKQIRDLEENINCGVAEILVLIEVGGINLAAIEFWKVRVMKYEYEKRKDELHALQDSAGPSGHQKLQVCDVCGAYLSRLDNDRRLADHFFGKMHIGFAAMRKAYDELKVKLKDRRPPQQTYYEDGPPAGPRDREFGGGRRRGGYRGGFGGGRGGGGRW